MHLGVRTRSKKTLLLSQDILPLTGGLRVHHVLGPFAILFGRVTCPCAARKAFLIPTMYTTIVVNSSLAPKALLDFHRGHESCLSVDLYLT
jgi:hypothetical protein